MMMEHVRRKCKVVYTFKPIDGQDFFFCRIGTKWRKSRLIVVFMNCELFRRGTYQDLLLVMQNYSL